MKTREERIFELREKISSFEYEINVFLDELQSETEDEKLKEKLDIAKEALNYIRACDVSYLSAQKALDTLKLIEHPMTNKLSLKERISKLNEDSSRLVTSLTPNYLSKIDPAECLNVIKELQEIIEIQTSNMLLAQHKILSQQSDETATILHHSIEKTKKLLGE